MSADPPTLLLLALVGLPGSGKSTLARSLCDPSAGHPFHALSVAYDDAPRAGGAPWSPAGWHAGRTESLLRVAAALAAARAAPPAARCVVIADDNAWYRSMRRPLRALARDAGAAFLSLHLDLGPRGCAVAAARDGARAPGERVGAPTIERMAAALEAPGGGGWEGAHAWAVDAAGGAEGVAAAVAARLRDAEAWAALPVPRAARRAAGEAAAAAAAAARAAAAESLVHQCDLALRRAVGRAAAAARAAGAARGAADLAAAKAAAMAHARAAAATGALQAALGGWPPPAAGGSEGSGGEAGGGEAGGGEGGALQRLQEWADARVMGGAATTQGT